MEARLAMLTHAADIQEMRVRIRWLTGGRNNSLLQYTFIRK